MWPWRALLPDIVRSPPDRFIQRLAAVRPYASTTGIERHPLPPVNPPRAS
ncbi:MAG: hypothetical protein WCJ87_04140 [Burkholderiales bacterium]